MSSPISPATPELNRLRAAAALIPIIEIGLSDAKLSVERATMMASFCEWSASAIPSDPEAVRLAEAVTRGLKRVRETLSALA
ncbi:hypothetical protein [Accumulibacter sp.]|uniref:hypothetical protein n=1 Tax=Accumulibacter sp. TaxID=2053492 RepID=UPI0025D7CE7C|nr:hypothetical protein [Accumulibacter sp.]MCM8594761.1 hypothetical protein [Accumulibacter sp.]MCM8625822.1 hypothetical protein [Accumulibacter sp.]MDS4048907.1 hypothetical protein [Accumulibacter sp.]